MRKLISASRVALAALVVFAPPALAAVTPNSVVTGQKIQGGGGVAQVTNGSYTNITLYTGGANGSKCVGFTATTNDTSAETITISLYNGTTYFPLTTVSVPAGSGTAAATPPVNMSANAVWPLPADGNGNGFIYIPAGSTLTISAAAAPTSGKTGQVFGNCQDF